MIRNAIGILLIGSLVIACNKKAVPVITERKQEPPKKEIAVTSLAENFIADTTTGKAIFMGRCGRCHGLPEPNLYTSKRWDVILTSMLPKARVNGENAAHITAYLKMNAAK